MGQRLMALALGVAAASGTAIAQDGPPRGPMGMMMRADTNGDGTITRAEYQAETDARFARRDANGNGRIDDGEGPRPRGQRADAPPPPPPAPATARPAGAVPPAPPPTEVGLSRDQFRARAMERFDRLDADRDGRIDAAEMRAGMPVRGARPTPPPPPPAN